MSSRAAIVCLTLLIGIATWAADPPVRYLTCPVSQLEIIEGTLPLPKYNQSFPGDRNEIWPNRQIYPPAFAVKWDAKSESELVIAMGSGEVSRDHVSLEVRAPSWDHVFLAVRAAAKGP